MALPLQSTTSHIPTIGVTAAGLPRIYAASDFASTQGFHYLSCDSNCDEAASWQDLRVSNRFPTPDPLPRPSLPFAVSRNGAAVFVSSDNFNMTASYCAGSCSQAASWGTPVNLGGTYTYPESVVFGSDGGIEVAARHELSNSQSLLWLTCPHDCGIAANWGGLDGLLTLPGQINSAVARTSGGSPRIVAYVDDPGTPATDHIFALLTCDHDCLTGTNWQILSPLPVLPESANVGFSIALDASDRPSVAHVSDFSSGFLRCTENCTSVSGVWEGTAGISTEALNQAVPPTIPASCLSASWMMYTGPAFVLDGQGNPIVGVTGRAKGLGGQCGTGSLATMTGSFLSVPP
jgi:hypothetical protein